MKPVFTYYGGKQRIVHKLLPLVPPHTIYTESFAGSAALYFFKEPSDVEVLNDNNTELVNLFQVLRYDYLEFKRKVELTPYSRALHKVAMCMYRIPTFFTKEQRAWAFWILTNQGFSGVIRSWSYANNRSKLVTYNNKKLRINEDLVRRLEHTYLECTDALDVIKSRDTEKSFHFIDPPYVGNGEDQGHYTGYGLHDFEKLLKLLATIDGKFMLTTYETPLLNKYIKDNGWHTVHIATKRTAEKAKGKVRKETTEVVTMNYDPEKLNKTDTLQ